MKRLILTLFLVAVVFSMMALAPNQIAYADAQLYTDEDFGIQFSLPDGWIEISKEQDGIYKTVLFASLNGDSVGFMYRAADLYAALPEYLQQWKPRSDFGMNYLSEDQIKEMLGTEVKSIEQVSYGGTAYYKMEVDTELVLLRMGYGWVYLFRFAGGTNPSSHTDFENLINSIVYSNMTGEESVETQPETQPEAFIYTDERSGIQFLVPEGWVQTEFNTNPDMLTAKFTNSENSLIMIMYGAKDLYEEMPYYEKMMVSRAAVGMDMFPAADMAALIGCEKDEIKTVIYGGKDYYRITLSSFEALYRIENGWLHCFQFGGGKVDSALYYDFESLIRSSVYPDVTDEQTPHTNVTLPEVTVPEWTYAVPEYSRPNYTLPELYLPETGESETTTQEEKSLTPLWVVLGILAVAVIAAILRKNRNVEHLEEPKVRYCSNCGAVLRSGSTYCDKCGTQNKE